MPGIANKLNRLDTTIVAVPIDFPPINAEIIDANNSGNDVPNTINVEPIIFSDNP